MTDDPQWVARAQAGDTRAFEVLVNRHATLVYNLALRLVRDPREAEDLTQEAFLRAWRGLPGFRSEARFGTWLYRIVTHLCYDRLPRLAAELAALDPDDLVELAAEGPGLDGALLTEDLRAHLHQALDGLPEGFRLLLTLRHLQGLSYADIALATGLPEGTVKSGIFRARAQLRAAVARYHAAEPLSPEAPAAGAARAGEPPTRRSGGAAGPPSGPAGGARLIAETR